MSSEYPGNLPEYLFDAGKNSDKVNIANFNPPHQFSLKSALDGTLLDSVEQIRRPDLTRKRPVAEYHQHGDGWLGFYLRNVKTRPNYQHASPISPLSPVDFSPVPSGLTEKNPTFVNPRYGRPVPPVNAGTGLIQSAGQSSEILEKKMMNHRLQELEKQLLGDGEDEEDTISVVTNSRWSDTIQNLIDPTRGPVFPSPTSSSSSSCSSTPLVTCTMESLVDTASAVSEGKLEATADNLARLQQIANLRGASKQRLTAYVIAALKRRVNSTVLSSYDSELYSEEHAHSIQMLYDASPCFKLGFMAANLAILEETASFQRIHILDFDIGQGKQYVHFLHALVGKNCDRRRAAPVLSITAFSDFISGDEEKLRRVGEGLQTLASKIGVNLDFSVKKLNIGELSREKLGIHRDEALAVNFAFKLHKLPDESVTTENLRDEVLRRVKRLSPAVMTVVEQEMNANTAPLTVRVREICEHYGALFDSMDATASRENPERIRIEEALGRKMSNSVACDGKDRVERCEVLGKWRARMNMAGFEGVPMSEVVEESLRLKLNAGTRVNPGFTISQQSGSICFGWMNRILTVASAWR